MASKSELTTLSLNSDPEDVDDRKDDGVQILSEGVIESIDNYCQNIQISANKYYCEENQRLACLISNIYLILKTKWKPAGMKKENDKELVNGNQNAKCDEFGDNDVNKLVPCKASSTSTLDTGTPTSLQDSDSGGLHVQKIVLELKQQVEAFHNLTSDNTPCLKEVCQQLTSFLEGKSVEQNLDLSDSHILLKAVTSDATVAAVKVEQGQTQNIEQNDTLDNALEQLRAADPGKNAVSPMKESKHSGENIDENMPMDLDPEGSTKQETDDYDSDADTSAFDSDDSDADAHSPPKKKLKIIPPEDKAPSLEEQVFGNNLLIKTILKNLDTRTLQQVRIVNKCFNNFATEILVNRQCLKVVISHDRIRVKKDDGQLVNLDLYQSCESLMMSIKLFNRLPTDHLELLNTNLESPPLQNFLSQNGDSIKTLKLDFHPRNVSVFAFQHMLLHQVPNLHTLYLDNVPSAWTSICADLKLFVDHQGPIKLHNLKSIKLGPQRSCVVPPILIQHLVSSSVNLLEVKGCRGTNFLAFLPKDKNRADDKDHEPCLTQFMKSLSFDPHSDNLDLYERLLDQQSFSNALQIKKLELEMEELISHPDTWPRVASIINQLLKLNSSHLETIVINDRLGFLEQNQLLFPKLSHVKKLKILVVDDHVLKDCQKKVLPQSCQISDIFPTLEILKIVMWENCDDEPSDLFFRYFANPLVIPSVINLQLICELDCQLSLYWLEQFCGLVPNVKIANFGVLSIGDFVEASRCIWNQLLKLQQIKFTVDVDTFVMETLMDGAFTGFSEDTCRRLRKQQMNRLQSQMQNKVEIRAEDWEDEREFASILDLKELSNLRLDFVLKAVRKNPYPVFLSCVAGLYAFQLCPRLIVSIGVDTTQGDPTELSKCLETIRPYVMMDSTLN